MCLQIYSTVLILVLMEDTLRGCPKLIINHKNKVLILVLMEDTLRDRVMLVNRVKNCLNPCFNGRYSQRDLNFSERRGL